MPLRFWCIRYREIVELRELWIDGVVFAWRHRSKVPFDHLRESTIIFG